MAVTGYTVATASRLLGAKLPVRREADEVYGAKMKAADARNKANSKVQRTDSVKTVRFHEDEDSPDRTSGVLTATTTNPGLTNASVTSSYSEKEGRNRVYEDDDPLQQDGRVQELRARGTLPVKDQGLIVATKIDPAFANPSGLGRSDSTSSRRTRRDSQVIEIYFSPVDVNRSRVELSEPFGRVDHFDNELLTPTQESYNASLTANQEQDAMGLQSEALHLAPQQLDRLTKALAESPLLQMHVRKQWWDDLQDDKSDRGSMSSEKTPSLSSGSGSASSTLYSHTNRQFVTEQRSPSVTQAILEEEFALDFPDHPNAKKPVPPTAKFGGIALTDPKVHGSPIRFVSRGYRLGANVINVGSCSFLNVGYGASVESTLRIEPPSGASTICRVMLQVLNHVIDRKSGKKTYLLVAELDVTESFVKAALCEVATHAGIPLNDIELVCSTPTAVKMDDEDIDWCALADELEAECAITDTVEAVASSFASLTAEHCTMQTLTLMSELERLKTRHQDFMILRPDGQSHTNGMPSSLHVPWISQHLDRQLYDDHEGVDAAKELRYQVVSAAVHHLSQGSEFETKLCWHGRSRSVRCVPLLESRDERRLPTAWVCFINGVLGVWLKR